MNADPVAPLGSITVEPRPEATVVHLAGEVDVDLRPQASIALSTCLARGLPIVLDTTAVRFADSYVIAFLLQCATCGRQEGIPVSLPDPAPAIQQVLELSGVDDIFGPAT